MKGKETVHIPWMNEMSDHQRSLLKNKKTQLQLTTSLYRKYNNRYNDLKINKKIDITEHLNITSEVMIVYQFFPELLRIVIMNLT